MRKKRGCRGSGVVSGMADTDDNGGGELAPLGIIKKSKTGQSTAVGRDVESERCGRDWEESRPGNTPHSL